MDNGNKRLRVYPDWSNMLSGLLGQIFNKLQVKEKRQFAKVCRSWRTVADDEILLFLKSFVSKSIWLLLPDSIVYHPKMSYNMYSVEDEKVSRPLILPSYFGRQRRILCSCRGGWTFLTEEKDKDLKLWSPLFDYKIRLPYFPFPSIGSKILIKKSSIFKLGVAMIYGDGKVGFVKYGDCEWSNLVCGFAEDLTCWKDSMILVLTNNGESIQIWDFKSSSNILKVKLDFPRNMSESKEPEKYHRKLYVVESKGKIFLVVRWIAEFVHSDSGLHLTEDDIDDIYDMIEEDDPLLFAFYQTVKFYVYVLDLDEGDSSKDKKGKWIRVESLGDEALFVGGNQSVSLRAEDFGGCLKNSIYFTDDYWERMEEHECYGGHDIGVFCLEDSSFDDIFDFLSDKYFLPSFWII